jgi:hypothetical protein
MGPHPDRSAPATSPAGAQPMPAGIPDDAETVCSKCDLPVIWNGHAWEHAEMADAVACAIFSGGAIIIEEDSHDQ